MTNVGKSPATGLWLTVVATDNSEIPVLNLSTNYVNITELASIIRTENVSVERHGLGWTAYVPNLSPGASLTMLAHLDYYSGARSGKGICQIR